MRHFPSRSFPAALIACLAVVLLLPALAGAAPGDAALRQALTREMRKAGSASGAIVVEGGTNRTVFSWRPDVPRIPASVEKLATTGTVLRKLGAEATIPTVALAAGRPGPDGVVLGDLVLKGYGDPTLDDEPFGPTLAQLADGLVAAGVTQISGHVVGDESFFDGFRGGPTTSFRYGSDVGGMLSALTLDRGRPLGVTPGLAAARRLRSLLVKRKVAVGGTAVAGTRPEAGTELASVSSSPLARIAQITNRPSNNFRAEMLVKLLGARLGGAGTTTAGAKVVAAETKAAGTAWQVADGSGLSRSDRVSPRGVVNWIASTMGTPAGPAFRESLAIPGNASGTLWKRMRGTTATARCRAKTGTLRDTSSLAGVCQTSAGRTLYFAFLANGISTYYAKLREDRMAVRVANAAAVPATGTTAKTR